MRASGLRRSVVAVGSLVVMGLLSAAEVQAASQSDVPVCRGAGKRFALLIGNQDYKGLMSTLANPRRDTQAFANLLCSNGFTVYRYSDLDISGFDAALAQFANVTRGAQTSLVYYSGHGFAAAGRNWLVPIDAGLDCNNLGNADNADVNFLQRRLVDLSSGVLGRLEGSGDQIVILDACRTDPIRSCFRGGAGLTLVKGFDRVSTSSGRLVLYATQNGKPARDAVAGSDTSPLMTAMVKKLALTPQRDWLSAMGDVSREVAALTQQEQVPNLDVSIPPQGCLAGNCDGPTTPGSPQAKAPVSDPCASYGAHVEEKSIVHTTPTVTVNVAYLDARPGCRITNVEYKVVRSSNFSNLKIAYEDDRAKAKVTYNLADRPSPGFARIEFVVKQEKRP